MHSQQESSLMPETNFCESLRHNSAGTLPSLQGAAASLLGLLKDKGFWKRESQDNRSLAQLLTMRDVDAFSRYPLYLKFSKSDRGFLARLAKSRGRQAGTPGVGLVFGKWSPPA